MDARLSFDTRATVERARGLIALYQAAGVPRERVLIKIASTWEGIQAARVLQAEGIRCNLTLLFCLPQATACADAGVQLISPFVGRIYDWHKKNAGAEWVEDAPAAPTIRACNRSAASIAITSASASRPRSWAPASATWTRSWRWPAATCWTISPELLTRLSQTEGEVPAALSPQGHDDADAVRLDGGEVAFRTQLNEDAMASEKLSEGIRLFVADARKLDALIESHGAALARCGARHGHARAAG